MLPQVRKKTEEEIKKTEEFRKEIEKVILNHFKKENTKVKIQSMTLNFYFEDENCSYIWEF